MCIAIAIGVAVGVAAELGRQMAANLGRGCGAMDNINWRNVAIAGVIGGIAGAGTFAAAGLGGAGLAEELGAVESHLASIDAMTGPNEMMLDRIAGALQEGRALTVGEQNFLLHETTEARLVAEGMSQEAAHAGALETHPLYGNYDPEVIKAFPEYFNSNWRAFWGIE
jgi:hypothetical protein